MLQCFFLLVDRLVTIVVLCVSFFKVELDSWIVNVEGYFPKNGMALNSFTTETGRLAEI